MTRTHATGSQFRVLVYVFFPSGGISRYSSEMFSAIAKRLPESAVGLLAPPEYPWQRGAATERLMSISSHHAVVRRARFLLAQIINPLLLIRAARRRRAEWIHFANVNTVFYPLWGWLLRRSASRVAISVHDVSRTKGIINLRWELRQLRRIYRDADALFVHSHEQSAHLVAFADVPRDRIHIVPHGPLPFDGHGTPEPRPRLLTRLGLDPQCRSALFFGFIRDEKRLDVLLRAMATRPEWQLIVAGNAGARGHRPPDHYRRLAADLGLGDRVAFECRFIADAEVPALFGAADCVVLPYDTRFSSQSGVFNVAAEFGTPILATPCPSFREILGRFQIGRICDGDSPDQLATGLTAIDADIRSGRRFDFASYREQNSWDRNAELTLAAYQKHSD